MLSCSVFVLELVLITSPEVPVVVFYLPSFGASFVCAMARCGVRWLLQHWVERFSPSVLISFKNVVIVSTTR